LKVNCDKIRCILQTTGQPLKKLKRGTANKPIMGIHGKNKDYPIFPKQIRKRWKKE